MRESEGRNRPRVPVLRPLFVFAALAALAVVLVPTGSAKPPASNNKNYSLCLQGAGDSGCPAQSQLSAGSATQMTLTITNAAGSPSSLGSMNFDAPAGLPIISANGSASPAGDVTLVRDGGSNGTGELQIRNLNLAPGSAATLTFSVQAPCTGGSFTWPNPETKQSNDFNGTGNDFNNPTPFTGNPSVLGGVGCYLGFLNQPAATQVGHTITDAIGSSGGPIEVGLFNADGPMNTCPVTPEKCKVTITASPANAGFTGTKTQPLVLNGGQLVASFGDLSIGGIPAGQLPATFKLQVASAFTSPAPPPTHQDISNPFEIALDIADCTAGCDVHGLGLGGKGSSLLDFSTDSNYGFVILDPTTVAPQYGCENWSSVGVAGFSSTDQRVPGSGGMTVTYYVPMKAIQAKYGANVGQQIIPLCVGAKPVVDGHAIDCTANGSTVGELNDPNAWVDDTLTGTPGGFTGFQSRAVCNGDGFYYGIIGSKQDPIDPTINPIISSFSSGTINGTNYRALVMSVPGNWDYKGGG